MDLLQLESIHDRLAGVFTPLHLPQWETMLRNHPDKEYTEYILKGIQDGFRVGFNRNFCTLSSARKNMHSAEENVQVVDDYLESEKHRNVLGPSLTTYSLPDPP